MADLREKKSARFNRLCSWTTPLARYRLYCPSLDFQVRGRLGAHQHRLRHLRPDPRGRGAQRAPHLRRAAQEPEYAARLTVNRLVHLTGTISPDSRCDENYFLMFCNAPAGLINFWNPSVWLSF